MSRTIITALDIGSTNVRSLIAAINSDDKLDILGMGHTAAQGIEKGVVKDIQALSGAIAKSLSMAEKAAETKAQNLFVNIGGEHIRTQLGDGRISIPTEIPNEPGEIEQEHVDQVIADAKNSVKIQKGFERHKILHGVPHDYIIDSQEDIQNPINMDGFHLTAKVLTILGEVTPIRNLAKCIELAGYEIDPDNFVLNHIALSHSVLSYDERRLGALLMDIGGGTVDISIYKRNALEHLVVVPMAGQAVSEDLAIGLKTTISNAEYIKKQYGKAIADENTQDYEIEVEGISGRASTKKSQFLVSHVIQRRIEEILALCYNRSKDYYTPELVTAGIILSGGTANLENIDEALYQAFNMQVKIARPDQSLLSQYHENLDNPAFSTLLGILYYAHKECEHPETKSFSLPRLADLKEIKLLDKIKKIIKDFI